MRDPNDKLTAELLPTPARRGRPPKAKALTNAEKQARHRAKRDQELGELRAELARYRERYGPLESSDQE